MATMTYGGTDIRVTATRTTSAIFLDLVAGYAEPALARGVDTIIPGATGRVARVHVKDVRRILLEGYVIGTSASDWRSKTDTLMALLSPAAAPANLVLGDSYLGVSGTKTISCRVVNVVGGPIDSARFQTWSIELESLAAEWS